MDWNHQLVHEWKLVIQEIYNQTLKLWQCKVDQGGYLEDICYNLRIAIYADDSTIFVSVDN